MPIAAALSPLKTQISSALKLERSASQASVAAIIASATAGLAPMGLFPRGPTMIPLVPSGFSACRAQIQNALKMERAAKPSMVAQIMALGISVLCPIVPPAGLSACKAQMENAFKMDRAATPNAVAQIIALAIVNYYLAGGAV